jgi:hypothetical protein
MKNVFLSALVLLLICPPVFAHGGEDHGDSKPATTKNGLTSQTAAGERMEALIKYPILTVGKPVKITVFVTDRRTNRGIAGLRIDLSLGKEGTREASVLEARPGQTDGAYEADFVPAAAGSLPVRLQVRETGGDIESFAFSPLPIPPEPVPPPTFSPPVWILLLSAGMAVLAGVLLFGVRRGRSVADPVAPGVS